MALTLQLGRAELRAGEQPEVRHLITDAQREAPYAIAELRDLARGIVPPLLADRGLVAAVESLAARYGLGTAIDAETHRSLAPAVESAAYFVIAEALTNTAKHARRAAHLGAPAATSARRCWWSSATTAAAAPTRAGSGLAGLRARVEALDGRLRVESPPAAGRRRGEPAVRVVIAEDLALLREGLVALLRENDIEVVAQVEDGPGLLRAIAGHEPGPGDRRRAPAADVQRRGPAGGDRGAPPPARAGRAGALPVRRDRLRQRADRREHRRASATC